MSRNARGMVLAVVALALAWVAGPARADVSGLGPGDSLGDPAGPMQMGARVLGRLQERQRPRPRAVLGGEPGLDPAVRRHQHLRRLRPRQLLPDLGHAAGHRRAPARRRGQRGGHGAGGASRPATRSSGPFRRRATTSSSWRETATWRRTGSAPMSRAPVALGGGGGGGSGGAASSPPQITRLHSAGRQRGTAVRALLTLRPAASRVTASAGGRRTPVRAHSRRAGGLPAASGPRPGRGIAPGSPVCPRSAGHGQAEEPAGHARGDGDARRIAPDRASPAGAAEAAAPVSATASDQYFAPASVIASRS